MVCRESIDPLEVDSGVSEKFGLLESGMDDGNAGLYT
jgi:hypothetical protein